MEGNFQHSFKLYINDLKTILSLAQSAGFIDNYRLEVIFSTKEISRKETHFKNLYEGLQNMLLIMQKIILELSSSGCKASRSTLEKPIKTDSNRTKKRLHGKNQCEGTLWHIPQVDACSVSPGKENCIVPVNQFNNYQEESSRCLSPQHPTTKETEAANVLMNLSGKATDIISHERVDVLVQSKEATIFKDKPTIHVYSQPFPSSSGVKRVEASSHSKEVTVFEGKPAVFSLPSPNSSNARLDSNSRRDHLMCDEVPQINEKDLLPLATQVLCQFCSKQCEDLVELHEHVLAMHNVPDSEPSLVPSVKKVKTSTVETYEPNIIPKTHSSFPEMQKKTFSCNVNPMHIPVSSHNLVQVPVSSHNPVQIPVSSQNPVQIPVSSHNPMQMPASSHNPVQIPVSSQNPVQIPVSSHNPMQMPASSHNPVQIPVSSQNLVQIPVSSQKPVQIPVSTQNPVQIPVSSQAQYNTQEIPLKQIIIKDLQIVENVTLNQDNQQSTYSTSYLVCSESSQNPNEILYYSEGRDGNCIALRETPRTTRVMMTPKDAKSAEANESVCVKVKPNNTKATPVKKDPKVKFQIKQRGESDSSNTLKAGVSEQTEGVNDALAIAVKSSMIKIAATKVTIFVCFKCSVCYTHNQEYKNHCCTADQPFINTHEDGSVVLVDAPNATDSHLHQNNSNIWYFPEFVIFQKLNSAKEESQVLEIVHGSSGRKMLLQTSYQPSYLGEQIISFRCQICDHDFDSLSRFLEHLTAGPCMFRCPECSLIYKTQSNLQAHRASMHPKIEERTCPKCHQVFEKRHLMNRHLKTKCSTNHTCEVCRKVLKNEYTLRVHMQSHKQERKYACLQCGDKFYRRSILRRHMMRHSGTRPYTCSICQAKFYTKQHRNTHLDRHSGNRQYPCSICKKAYYSRHDLNNHFHKVHNKSANSKKPPDISQDLVSESPEVTNSLKLPNVNQELVNESPAD